MYMLSSGDVYWLVKYFYDNVLSLHKISDLTSAGRDKIMNFDMSENRPIRIEIQNGRMTKEQYLALVKRVLQEKKAS